MELEKYSLKSISILLNQSMEMIKEQIDILNIKKQLYNLDDIKKIEAGLGIDLKDIKGHKILFISFKGGTGKTTLSSSTAYRLAEIGYKVLAIDLDAQGHLTKCLGLNEDEFSDTIYNVVIDKKPIEDVIMKTSLSNLDIIPANISLSPIELSLMSMNARELRIKKALEAVGGSYNFIVLDAPPNFGLLNLNAILAADDITIPLLADFLSYQSIKLIFEAIDDVKEDFEQDFKHIYILLNHYNDNYKICRESKEALKNHYSKYLLNSIIRQSTQIARATSSGQPILKIAPSSKAVVDLTNVVYEIISNINAEKQVE